MNWLLRTWLPIAIAVTGVCALAYVSVQQVYRLSLNDPQIQMTEDAAAVIVNGGEPADLIPGDVMVDAEGSLAPWLAVYDAAGRPIVSSAELGKTPPMPPREFFDYAKAHGTTLPDTTWETPSGTRIALVVRWVPESNLYVAAGRNMREIEHREWQLTVTVGVAWLCILVATLVATWLGARLTAEPGEPW